MCDGRGTLPPSRLAGGLEQLPAGFLVLFLLFSGLTYKLYIATVILIACGCLVLAVGTAPLADAICEQRHEGCGGANERGGSCCAAAGRRTGGSCCPVVGRQTGGSCCPVVGRRVGG